METKRKKLPIGIQTFEKIREDNYIYVDKTRFLVNMIDNGSIFFFARPRRFGKSLTVSTLDAMFAGKKELFKGLYAEEFMNRADYHSSPVIRLDMSHVTTNEGIQVVQSSIARLMRAQAERYDIKIDKNMSCGESFDELISKLYTRYGQVVILLDEYDKPYTDFYNKPEKAEEIRDVLRNLYGRIKANDRYIRFVFITGIAKFARFGVFSVLNNPNDISMDTKYGEMCGLTEKEIVQYFPDHIAETAKEIGITPSELLERMRRYYDGFCFDGVHRLYNPFSTLNFFDKKRFLDFWMNSGTPKIIADYLKTRSLTVEQFRNLPISMNFVNEPGDIDTTPPEGFLLQTGYLTIRKVEGDDFTLDYPNTEVLNAMSALLAQNILPTDNPFGNLQRLALFALEEKDESELVETINALLASIPYDDFSQAGKISVKLSRLKMQAQEWIYRSTILAFFRGCGVVVLAEMHTNLGRADLVISHRGNTYVIELKVAYKSEDVPVKLAEALDQMKQKNYLAPYPGATGLAIVIDDTKRQITASDTLGSDSSFTN